MLLDRSTLCPCDDGKSGQLGERPDVALRPQSRIAILDESDNAKAHGNPENQPTQREEGALWPVRRFRQVRGIYEAECLALLLMLQLDSHRGRIQLGFQSV